MGVLHSNSLVSVLMLFTAELYNCLCCIFVDPISYHLSYFFQQKAVYNSQYIDKTVRPYL